jgi:hypothetical protein
VLCSQYGRTVNGTTAYVAGSTRVVRFPIEGPHTRLPLTYRLLRSYTMRVYRGIRRRYLSYRYRRGTAVRRVRRARRSNKLYNIY